MHIQNLVKLHQFVLKALSGNEFRNHGMTEWSTTWKQYERGIIKMLFLRSLKAFISLEKIYLVVSRAYLISPHRAYPQNKLKVICQLIFVKLLSVKKILINPSPDVVKINAFTKFSQIPSTCSQDIELKTELRHKSRAITLSLTDENSCITIPPWMF